MLNYAVCEINKKQIKLLPNTGVLIDFVESEKKLYVSCLLLVEDGKVEIGTPYLKDKIALSIVESTSGKKSRVSKYHAKSNYRRTIGHRSKYSRIIWNVKRSVLNHIKRYSKRSIIESTEI